MDANGTGAVRGKSILVTGGGSGIGLGVASLLAGSGAHVTICGRTEEKLIKAAASVAPAHDGSITHHAADVTDEDSVIAAVAAAAAVTGRLDGVVACAGGNETIAPVTQIDVDAWRRTVELNITGTMLTLKHSARELVRGGADRSSRSPPSRAATPTAGSARTASRSPASTTSSSSAPMNWVPAMSGSTASGPGSPAPIWSPSSPRAGRCSRTTGPALPCPASGSRRTSRRWRGSCSATSPPGSPDRSSTSTVARC
ncbi:short-chain type dehydrogenase/reductase [Rhodococcus sp. MTM3W5.2]|nr:short-chain type dehydrogenase/reductase [Rhodococcus sp. MTM3W5.2]